MPAAISMHGCYKITKKLSTTAKWWKQREIHDLELYQKLKLTEKEKRTQTRKLKRFLTKSKGCRAEEICHWSTM